MLYYKGLKRRFCHGIWQSTNTFQRQNHCVMKIKIRSWECYHEDKNEKNHCLWYKAAIQRHNYSHTGVGQKTSIFELENMLENVEDLEKPLSRLIIKYKDKTSFTKRNAYKKREADKISRPGWDKKNQHQSRQRQIKQPKALTIDKCRSATNVERKDTTLDTANTRKLNVM